MSKNIKILYPTSIYYPSQIGGPSNSIYWMCQGLKNSSFIKTIVITSKIGLDLDQIKLNKWYVDGNNSTIYTSSDGILHFKLIFKTISQVNSCDIIHLNSLFYLPSIIIAFLSRFIFRKKVVVSIRGELDKYALNHGNKTLKKIFIWLWGRLKNHLTFHCTVEEEKNYAEKFFGKNVNVIQLPNYILKPAINLNLKKRHDKSYLLYLGRLHEIKGIENLLHALAKSELFFSSQTILKIAGQGDSIYENKLKKLVADLGLNNKIDFLGQIEGDEKERILSQAYFLTMPSHTENFGNVVVESLIHGTPVIASTGTPWKVLKDTRSGFWVDNSVESLTKTLNSVLNMDKTEYDILSNNAIKLVDEEFDIQNNYMKWANFYSQLSNRKS